MTSSISAKEASTALALAACLLLLLRSRKHQHKHKHKHKHKLKHKNNHNHNHNLDPKQDETVVRHQNPQPSAVDESGNHVALTYSKIDTGSIITMVGSPKAGAIATFSGTTRDNFEGKEVVRLEYECYEEMALKEMRKICTEIREKWKVERISITHRLGLCPVGDASVVIAVSSAHRGEALEGVSYAINRLKAKVPIWKKEIYSGGNDPSWKQNVEFKQR